MTPDKLIQKFANRRDIYMLETPNYRTLKKTPLDEVCVEKHLSGEYSLHIHSLNKKSKCKWGCIDLDADNFKNLSKLNKLKSLNQMKKKAFTISKLFPEFETIIEFTGNRGYHIWVFFEKPKYGGLVRLILGARLRKQKIFDVEIFPKQDRLSESAPHGNTVRMPLGIHPKSNKRSVFIK